MLVDGNLYITYIIGSNYKKDQMIYYVIYMIIIKNIKFSDKNYNQQIMDVKRKC